MILKINMFFEKVVFWLIGLGIGGVFASLIGQLPIVGWSFEKTVITLLFSIAFMIIGLICRAIK